MIIINDIWKRGECRLAEGNNNEGCNLAYEKVRERVGFSGFLVFLLLHPLWRISYYENWVDWTDVSGVGSGKTFIETKMAELRKSF